MAPVVAAVEPFTLLKCLMPQDDGLGDNNGSADVKPIKAHRRESDPAAALAAARHEFGEHGGVNMSIEASITFTVMEPDTMRRLFAGELGPERDDLYIYSRHFNPTVLALGRQIAVLEGTEAAYCTASGMAAISSVLMQLVGAGGHVVASHCLYGGTHALLSSFLPRTSGVSTTFVDTDDEAAVRAAVRPGETKVVYVETMSNPTLAVADIPMLARVAHEAGAKLVVDNTFTPLVVSPARLGADVVVHSVSKFISGGADIIAGTDDHLRHTQKVPYPIA
jgi:methionine-gamma-lyase